MMGSAIHLHVTAAGKDTIIIVQTMDLNGRTLSDLAIGEEVSFKFRGSEVHVFDEDGINLEAQH